MCMLCFSWGANILIHMSIVLTMFIIIISSSITINDILYSALRPPIVAYFKVA